MTNGQILVLTSEVAQFPTALIVTPRSALGRGVRVDAGRGSLRGCLGRCGLGEIDDEAAELDVGAAELGLVLTGTTDRGVAPPAQLFGSEDVAPEPDALVEIGDHEVILPRRTIRCATLDAITFVTMPTSTLERAAGLDAEVIRSLDALQLAAALDLGDDLEGIVT